MRGASGSFVLKIAGTGLTMAAAILLARLLGPEGFGKYAFSLSVVQILTVPAMLGLQQLMVREFSAYNITEAFSSMRGLCIRAFQSVVVASLLLVGFAGAFAYFLADHIDALELAVFWPALILVPLTALIQVYGAAIRGLGRIVLSQIPPLLLKNGLFIFFLGIFVLFFAAAIDTRLAISLQVTATFFALILIFVVLFRVLPENAKQVSPEYKTREWIQSAVPMLFAGGMQILNREAAIIVLGALGSAEDVGFYRVAQRGADLLYFGLMAAELAIAPTISELYTSGQLVKLQRLLTKSARAVLSFTVPAGLTLMLGAKWLVPFIFGPDFVYAILPLIVLSAGQLLNAAMGIVGIVLMMTHNERLSAIGAAIAAIINVILNVSFVPLWGVVGAAIATSISLVIWKGLFFIWVYQRLGLVSTAYRFR